MHRRTRSGQILVHSESREEGRLKGVRVHVWEPRILIEEDLIYGVGFGLGVWDNKAESYMARLDRGMRGVIQRSMTYTMENFSLF